jgi:broad specificity phosphatase PhoE
MTTLVMVRHGHTALNRDVHHDQFRGQMEIPLDERGLHEAEITAGAVAARWQPAALYSSPVLRAMMTAQIIAKPLGLPVLPEPGLTDMDYGEWTGLTYEQARESWPALFELLFRTSGRFRAPHGGSLQGIRRNAVRAVKQLATKHDGQTIVLVTHTLVIRLVLLGAMGLPTNDFFRIRQDTCAINVLEREHDVFSLALVNDTCHIREAQLGR